MSNKNNKNKFENVKPEESMTNPSTNSVESSVPENVKPEENVVEPIHDECVRETVEVKSGETIKPDEIDKFEIDSSDIKVGDAVIIKENAKTVTGQDIPKFAYKNVYVVNKILDDRFVIKCGPSLIYGIAKSDVIVAR